MITQEITERLKAEADPDYRLFQCRLMPGVAPERVVGVRTPILRRLAKEYAKREDADLFLSDLPHATYDEYNLHGFMISECRDFEKAVASVDALLPYVDNWATCDLLSPKAFRASVRKDPGRLLTHIRRWIGSDRPFTIRFGIEMLMSHYLDDAFDPAYPALPAAVESDEYYVNMMIAWYFATALAKQWDAVLPYLTEHRLTGWVRRKTITK